MTRYARIIRRIRIVFYSLLGLAGLAALAVVVSFFVILRELPRVPDPLSRIIERPATEFYAATGERVLVLGGRQAVPLSRVSQNFIEAVVATEDHRFWSHHGVDKIRLFKAFLEGLAPGHRFRATSTITQQLAKNLFFSFERLYKRKFMEAMVAFQIESRYSKEEILEAYLNQITFGVNAIGVEQAALTFFGKPASDLTLAEASLLAGLPQAPSRYNPYNHLDRAKKRQRDVLGRMVAVGYISQKEADAAFEKPLDLRPRQASTAGSYFLDAVIKQLEDRYGPQVVYNGGLRVTTTLDTQLQQWATDAAQKGAKRLDDMIGIPPSGGDGENPLPQVAIAAIDVNSGAVKAVVGGRDYAQSEYNRAVQSNRLPGSGFKPFVYYTALNSFDVSPATVMDDKKITIEINGADDWTPNNFGKKFLGPMIVKRAFMESVNSVAAQLVEKTGPDKVIETARKCGITSPLASVYSIALGTSGVSPLEMASAFSVFASGGIRHEPFWIWRVEDVYGRALEEHIVSRENTLDPDTVFQLVDMMQGVVDKGTGKVIRSMGFSLPAGGKTGTTNDYIDAWFTGFTPSLSVSVWTGYDTSNRGLRDRNGTGITGGRAAAPIWADFMIKATGGEMERKFPVPPGIHYETVNDTTGYLTDDDDPQALKVALKEWQKPSEAPEPRTPSGEPGSGTESGEGND